MCTFENDRTVDVCDVAFPAVRAALADSFGDVVKFVHTDGQPTRVTAPESVPATEFRAQAERAIASIQE
ncbi:MAG: hypothetical protein ACR2MY_01895 [Candidatus Dormibacteria bacterium]